MSDERRLTVSGGIDSYEQNYHLVGNAIRVLARCLIFAASILAFALIAAALVIAEALG